MSKTDREVLDELAQWLGTTESWNGGDVCEALADAIAKTGRPHPGDADDYPEQWRAYLAERLEHAEEQSHLPELTAFAKDMRHAFTQDLRDNVAKQRANIDLEELAALLWSTTNPTVHGEPYFSNLERVTWEELSATPAAAPVMRLYRERARQVRAGIAQLEWPPT